MSEPTQAQPFTIFVTGGARRLGRALCEHLAAPGRMIIIHYNSSADGAEEVATAVRAQGAEATTLQANLNSMPEAEELAKAAHKITGCIDALINNAAIFYPTPLPEVTEEQYDAFMNLNLKAPFFLAQALTREMLKQDQGGCILNMIDSAFDRPRKRFVPYALSKAGLAAMTQGMAAAFGPKIRVNGIGPGLVLPPEDESDESVAQKAATLPLGRMGSAEDIARAAEYLIFNAPYVTGEILRVDGGRSIV